jgi:hydrogenase assembly chaperone HypC/HupF
MSPPGPVLTGTKASVVVQECVPRRTFTWSEAASADGAGARSARRSPARAVPVARRRIRGREVTWQLSVLHAAPSSKPSRLRTRRTEEEPMCLAVPGQVVQIFERDGIQVGVVDFGGVTKEVCLEYVPDLVVGDYTIVHVGFALQRLDEKTALETLDVL